MVRHVEAMAGDEEARQWLLDYNRGDVEATRAVREWVSGPGQRVPEVRREAWRPSDGCWPTRLCGVGEPWERLRRDGLGRERHVSGRPRD